MISTQNTPPSPWIACLFLLAMTACVFFPLSLPVFVPLTGLVGTAILYKTEKHLPKIDYNILLILLTISGLTIASSFWSVTPADSLERGFKISALLLLSSPFLFLCGTLKLADLVLFKKWAIIPLLIAAIILFIELKFSYPIYRILGDIPNTAHLPPALLNKHVATLMLMMPFGIVFALRARFVTLSILLMILCGLVLSVTESQSAQLSLIAMVFCVPALLVMPDAAPVLIFSGVAFLLAFMPWISPVAFDAFAEPLAQKSAFAHQANMSMRLENWDFLSRRIMENPFTGFGVDTTRDMTFDTEQKYFPANTILHPHNIALQIWIEFGLIGICFANALLAFIFHHFKKLSLTRQIMPLALFCGTMVFLMISWSIWAAWLDAFIVWIVGLLILVTRPKADPATS
jgi:O-antigen ligase